MQNIPKEKILDIVKLGPTIPNKIAKQLGAETLIVGAILSTLISTGEIAVSKLKIGGSPLYYVPQDEAKLEEFLDHLNEKDKKTVLLLKEKKVLQESIQDPLTRVSLRSIPDFAKSFEVELNEKRELFWRYYLLSKEEALSAIESLIAGPVASVHAPPVHHEHPVVVETSRPLSHETVHHEPVRHVEKESIPVSLVQEIEKTEETSEETEEQELIEKPQKEKSEIKSKEDFFEQLKTFLHHKNLDIINKEKIKKSEYSLVLKDHEKDIYYFCKAKDKKTISDGDLATAFVYAQSKKMSCIFITTGKLSKKATAMLHKEFVGLVIEYIE